VGGSSVGGLLFTFLKNKSRFDCFILDFWTLQKWAIKVSLKLLRPIFVFFVASVFVVAYVTVHASRSGEESLAVNVA
jgi:Na+-driven multidrug efflux pump